MKRKNFIIRNVALALLSVSMIPVFAQEQKSHRMLH